MSSGPACRDPGHRPSWQVVQRNGNASAFNGYHWTPSDYSAVRCAAPGCGLIWRTKAAYVAELPDAPPEWWGSEPLTDDRR